MSVEQSAMRRWAEWIVAHDVEEFKITKDKNGQLQMVITFKEGTRLPKPADTHYGPDWDLRFKW